MSATKKSPEKTFNWGWVALGGCLGLAVVLLLNPLTLSLLGMVLGAWQQERASDHRQAEATALAIARPPTPTLPALICDPVPPVGLARIEELLTVPGTRLRGAQMVRSVANPRLWAVAADLEGEGRYEGDDDIGVWTVRWEDATPARPPKAPASVGAVNGLAAQAGPFSRSDAERRLATTAVRCANEALGHG